MKKIEAGKLEVRWIGKEEQKQRRQYNKRVLERAKRNAKFWQEEVRFWEKTAD